MTDHRIHDEPTPAGAGRGDRSVVINRDVSGSTIVPGDRNVIITQPPANTVITTLHQLRAPVGDFVGREKEIENLIQALRHNSRASITGISGMGGIGKTELALRVAEYLVDYYPDAQFFINLHGTDSNPRTSQEVMANCIRAFLGPAAPLPEDLEQLTQLYRSQLKGKRVLLLLDNAANSAQVHPLLPPSGCALLVTSRQAITLPGMKPLTLNPLTEKEARELLLEMASHAERVADEICELCGYLPLAIRAAGSLLAITPDLDPVDYTAQLKAAQLEAERDPLELIGSEGVEIGVKASFNLSYVRLSPEAARVFRLLSVFPATFDAAAEEVVCVDTGHAQLSDLVRRSLVLYDSTTKRYRMHDLARLFAESKLAEEEKQQTLRKHANYFLKKAEAIEPHLGTAELGKHMDWFKAEQDNMRAAMSWFLEENNAEMALRMAYTLSSFWNILGQLKEERTALDAALERATHPPVKLHMRVLGRAALRQTDSERAKELAELHLKLSRETGDQLEEAWALENLGIIERTRGNLKEAWGLEDALKMFRQRKDKSGMARTLLNLGVLAVDLDDFVSAEAFITESLELNEELGNRADLPIARAYLAFLLHKRGERDQVDKLIGESLEMLSDDGRQSWLPWGWHWKGRIAIDRAEFETARMALKKSLSLFQQNEDTNAEIRSLLAFSWLNARQGDWERAATLLAAEESQRKQQQLPSAPDWKQEIEFIKTNSRKNLGDSQFATASAHGKQMTLDQAVAYAI